MTDLEKHQLVEAALRRQFISVIRPSRDSRYAAFLFTHCAYTLYTHMCYNRYPPHVDSNILHSTLLLALLFGCVVYASATLVTDSTRSPSKHGASQTPSAAICLRHKLIHRKYRLKCLDLQKKNNLVTLSLEGVECSQFQ
jgi:hypothetical protein